MADVLNDELPKFLRDYASREMRHPLDAAAFLTDWIGIVRKLTGLRARCSEMLSRAEWPIALGRLARSCGLHATDDPLTGDIAVIRAPDGSGAVPAIRSASGWAVWTERGILWTSRDLRVMAAWRVTPC